MESRLGWAHRCKATLFFAENIKSLEVLYSMLVEKNDVGWNMKNVRSKLLQ
jgi:hypothetical protein